MQDEWTRLMQGKIFITDLGETNAQKNNANRYAVWLPDKEQSGRHRIAEVGNDLHALSLKYKVKSDCILNVV